MGCWGGWCGEGALCGGGRREGALCGIGCWGGWCGEGALCDGERREGAPRGMVGRAGGVLKVPFGTLSLDLPVLLWPVLGVQGDSAGFAGTGRAASGTHPHGAPVSRKARSRHQGCRERAVRDTQRPQRHFRDIGHVAKVPFAAGAGAACSARAACPGRAARAAGLPTRTPHIGTASEVIGGSRFTVSKGSFAALVEPSGARRRCHRPCHWGFRLARNAATPSRKSSLP
jgi:hypothetical protein